MHRCIQCGHQEIERGTDEVVTGPVGGPSFRAVIPADICGNRDCGEAYYWGEDLQKADLAAALKLVARERLSGRAHDFCRKVAGLTFEELGRHYDVSPRRLRRLSRRQKPVPASWHKKAAAIIEALAQNLGPLPEADEI